MNNEQNHTYSARGREQQHRDRRGTRGGLGRNRRKPRGEQNSQRAFQQSGSTSDKSNTIDKEFVQKLRDRNRNRFTIKTRAESSSLRDGSTASMPRYDGRTAPSGDSEFQERSLHNTDGLSSGKDVSTGATGSEPAISLQDVVNDIGATGEPKIGVGRATGSSRVPDEGLSESVKQVQHNLNCLKERVERLLRDKQTVIEMSETKTHMAGSEKNMAEWESIHGEFRQLTMSITASTKPEVKQLAIPVYESAADASLYGGNLSFYLSCQTRLLKELYAELPKEQREVSRYSEFIGYSLLYFGVFHVDHTEIAQLSRGMDHYTTKDSSVRLSLSIISAVRNQDGMRMFALYNRCSVRQRVLVFPALKSIRKQLLSVLIRAYLQLSKTKTASFLGMENEIDTIALLAAERPDLAEQVTSAGEEYSFRVSP